MKNKLILAGMAMILASCKRQPFTGRVVDKEYIQGHMCHSDGYIQVHEASMLPAIIVPHVSTPPPHHHSWQPAEVTLWVADRYEVKSFSVDTTSYSSWVVGSKVTF